LENPPEEIDGEELERSTEDMTEEITETVPSQAELRSSRLAILSTYVTMASSLMSPFLEPTPSCCPSALNR